MIKTDSGRIKPSDEYELMLQRLYPEAREEEQAPMDAQIVRLEQHSDVLYLWVEVPAEVKLIILPDILYLRDQRSLHGTRLGRLACLSLPEKCRYRFLAPDGKEVLVVENLPPR